MKYVKALEKVDLGLVGVVNQASCQYLMAHMNLRGYCYGLVLVYEGVLEMMEFSWVDRDMRYFIVKIRSIEEGQAVLRHRWCQVVVDVNSNYRIVDLDIHQLVAADI